MVACECADEALFYLFFNLVYFPEKCVIWWDFSPYRELEGFWTGLLVYVLCKFPDGILRFSDVSLLRGYVHIFTFSAWSLVFSRSFREAVLLFVITPLAEYFQAARHYCHCDRHSGPMRHCFVDKCYAVLHRLW